MNPEFIAAYLRKLEIEFQSHTHAAVYTCEDANRLTAHLPGAATKNLFVRDKKGVRQFLVVVPDHKQVDLVQLAAVLGSSRLSMGSPERLKKVLGVEPGSVAILALVHDQDHSVELIIDKEIWEAAELQCHPLVNTATFIISLDGIRKFLVATGHHPRILELPTKANSTDSPA